MSIPLKYHIESANVHRVISDYMLADGFPMVFDLRQSEGVWCHDSKTGDKYLDLFTFFASAPIGYNHPKMTTPEMIQFLGEVAVNNITNSDLYTEEMASFIETFFQLVVPKGFMHSFFVAGGALANENALKAAFDWKVQKNFQKGYRDEVGQTVISFDKAFHGRTGYTLSLTRTEPIKYKWFPMFDWPKVLNPYVKFPLDEDNLADVQKRETLALNQVKQAFLDYGDDIAAIIIEPIQGEGGDNHFRPEFMKELKNLADENEAVLIFDCVQSGMGLTGKWWAFEHFGMQPDMFTFGKKSQVCGFCANRKIDDIDTNVFKVSSRINSTWGGNIIDMVRCAKYIEIIHEEKLLENAAKMGDYLKANLVNLAKEFPEIISNPRGRGLMCAFDLPSTSERNKFQSAMYENKVAILGSGERSIRFRPALTIQGDNIDLAIDTVRKVIKDLYKKVLKLSPNGKVQEEPGLQKTE